MIQSGWRIKKRRQAVGLTRRRMALMTGISFKAIVALEELSRADEETWQAIDEYLVREEDATLTRAAEILHKDRENGEIKRENQW